MCRLLRRGFQGASDYGFHLRIGDLSRCAWPRFVSQPFQAGSAKTASPFADRLVRDPQLASDLPTLQSFCAAQYDARTQCQSLRALRPACPLLEFALFLVRQHDRFGWTPHAGWTPSIAMA